jgi:hypothetical protein
MEVGCQNIKDYHTWQSSNVKLFSVQRRRGNYKAAAIFGIDKSNI